MDLANIQPIKLNELEQILVNSLEKATTTDFKNRHFYREVYHAIRQSDYAYRCVPQSQTQKNPKPKPCKKTLEKVFHNSFGCAEIEKYELKEGATDSQNKVLVFLATANSAARICKTWNSVSTELDHLSPSTDVDIVFGVNNSSDNTLEVVLEMVQKTKLPKNVGVCVYNLPYGHKVYEPMPYYSRQSATQNLLYLATIGRGRKPEYIMLIDDDITFFRKDNETSVFDRLKQHLIHDGIRVASGSFSTIKGKEDNFYRLSNLHKNETCIKHQVTKPTPCGACLMIRSKEYPNSLFPTGAFGHNDIYIYYYSIATSKTGLFSWPAGSFTDVIFEHPGEGLKDWVAVKKYKKQSFVAGELEKFFGKQTVDLIKNTKIELLAHYRKSAHNSVKKVYGDNSLESYAHKFIYQFMLPETLDGYIYN